MKWEQADRDKWFSEQVIKRSYQKDVVHRIQSLKSKFDVVQYGALSMNAELYPVYLLKSKKFDQKKKTALITGGVHGYETSGVQGALRFLENAAASYTDSFNIVCAPCVSPWGYETMNRWTPKALDPNRSFYKDSPAEESRLLIEALAANSVKPFVHFDLHETTDTDNTIFRPDLEKRDGVVHEFSEIPDGFYTVGNTEDPKPEFQKAVIESVRKVTHIAPHDQNRNIIGTPIEQEGVINYPLRKLFLCAGITDAEYTTTTEVYPDSPKVNDQICIDAQIAAIRGGLDYLSARSERA